MNNTSFKLFSLSTLIALQSSFGSYFEVAFSEVDFDTRTPMNALFLEGPGAGSNRDTVDIDNGISLKYGFNNGWSIVSSSFDASSLLFDEIGGIGVILEEIDLQNIMFEYTFENAIGEQLYWIASLGLGLAWVDYNIEGIVPGAEEDVENLSLSSKDRVPAFSAGVGIGYKINENFDLLLHYKINNLREVELPDIELPDWDMDSRSMNVGLRMKF